LNTLRAPIQFEIDDVKALNIAKILLGLIKQRHWLVSMPEYLCRGTFKPAPENTRFT